MSEENELHSERVYLQRISRDLRTLLNLVSKAVYNMEKAESEIPEHIRRFMTYAHDCHDITYMYEERGLPVPQHQLREMERCDDRYRQLLKELHSQGGTFEKVRTKMAEDIDNRWDHTRQLTFKGSHHGKPKEHRDGKSSVAEGQECPSGTKG